MTVTTLPTRTAPEVAPVPHGGALAVRPDQTAWTPEQAAVLRQSGIKDNVAPAELSSFLHLCQRTGLDPFSRQIYLIGRWSKKDGRDVYTPQTGIDGYRVIAQRVTAQTGGTYGYEDTVWCDASGRWRDVWLAAEPPAAAKVTVIRNGQRFSAVAAFREYVQTFPDGNAKGLWAKMPAGQIAKCAEALALRKAFPHDLAGVYTAEEMAQADNADHEQPQQTVTVVQSTPTTPPPATAPQQERRDYLAEAMAETDWEAVGAIMDDAHAAGAPEHYLAALEDIRTAHSAATVEDVRKLYKEREAAGAPAEHLARLAHIGSTKPAAAPQGDQTPTGPTPHSMSDAVAAEGAVPANVAAAERAAAERAAVEAENRLRLAASKANLPTLDADFERAYGMPIDQAPAVTIDAFRQMIEQAAAKGAQQ